MKSKKNNGVVKGAPSGFVISLMVHAGAFLLAGMLVVFTVSQKQEKKFVPPKPVDRPKMKLKKPKVQVKKSAKPKATNRIVTKVTRAEMPDIQLPEMAGISGGLGEGSIGGFEMMPDLTALSIFGSEHSIGNDFVGTFYDTKRLRSGGGNPGVSAEETCEAIVKFIKSGWKTSAINKYYRSPRKLYATTFTFPQMPAAMAPEAFGEKNMPGYAWFVHYKGQLVYPEDIKFRFWAQGDNLMVVRVDKKLVAVAPWPGWGDKVNDTVPSQYFLSMWQSGAHSVNRRYPLGNNYSVVGDWIELKAGEAVDMEVIVAVPSGGINCFLLCVEEEGKEYPKNPFGGGPTLPVFKTEEINPDLRDEILARLHEGDADVDSGPIFRDYKSSSERGVPVQNTNAVSEELSEPPPEVIVEKGPRIWTLTNGKTFEGEYLATMGNQATIKPLKGRSNVKVLMSELSQADQDYVQLSSPPKYKIDFIGITKRQPVLEVTPYWTATTYEPDVMNTFGVRVKQETARKYDYPLMVKYYAVGDEVDGNNLVLLSREEQEFNPSEQKKRIYEYMGGPVKTRAYSIRPDRAPMRGVKYRGKYLVTLTDSRGVIIQHKCAPSHLFDIRHKLDKLGMGRHFDKSGSRVVPPRPGESDRPVQFWD